MNVDDRLLAAIPRRSSLADEVYTILERRLIEGTIAAGSSIIIDGLAKEFAVSHTPIREALARLESTGLVSRTAHRGYRAAPLSTVEELANLMEARVTIEPRCAALASQALSDAFLAELTAAVEALDAYDGSRDFHLFWEADARFHQLIATNTGNRFLAAAFEALGGHVQRFRLFGALGGSDIQFAALEHGRILDAIRAGDAEAAEREMAAHLTNARDRATADRSVIAEL
ncbi:GntR family transcriptional regulator [Mycetocola reblochoni]|uniref:Transcriptional regulator, GntR family n=2 Tax=Mycetocola reblochoni TaxID=331618 RepID=A0A1R4K9T6_9MICO|nr:GntR family transcriptional regulator [Mycetocola reblochoni]RLP71183.1 GntR family transcriptional regulator [Mycetocola reblochoni]SJN41171.1 Transcriptional regulator, GntR family [Mycetocola reblochoni REB411]